MSYAHRATRLSVLALIAAALALALSPAFAAAGGKGHHYGHHGNHGNHKGKVVGTMTRNLYLGADLTPAILAPTLPAFVAANGQILREVTANNFPLRAEGLG